MGQSLNDSLPSTITSSTLSQLEKRFFVSPHPIYTNNPQFKLLHEKLTNKKYILRIITVNDESQRNKLEEKICRKTANKTNYLPKLEHYIFQEHKGYCGTVTKCYLLFQIGQATLLREQILRQTNHRVPFTEEELTKGVQNLIYGLLWLRYLKETHQNINTLNIYCQGNTFMLADPMIAPANNENPQRYISPQKQEKIENKIQEYDPYVSDIFSIGMCILEVIRNGHMEKMYKINGKLNTTLLISQIERCKYEKIKNLLKRLLINANNSQNRQIFLESFSKKFSASMVSSQMPTEKAPRIHQLGASKRRQSPPARNNNFITTQDVNKIDKIDGLVQPAPFSNFETSQIVYRMNNRPEPEPATNISHNENYQPDKYVPLSHSQQRPPQQPQNMTNFSYNRPQSVGKFIPTLDSLVNSYRREPSYNLPPYGPAKTTEINKVDISYVTKKLEYGSKESLASYGVSAVSNRFSKDLMPSYGNTAVPYTSSSFWNSMNSGSSYDVYKINNQTRIYEPKKPFVYEDTSKRESSLPKKFSLERKYSEKGHFQKYLEMHDTLKKQSKKDDTESLRQSQASIKQSEIQKNEPQNVEDAAIILETNLGSEKKHDCMKEAEQDDKVQQIEEKQESSPQRPNNKLEVEQQNQLTQRQISEMKVVVSTSNAADFGLPNNSEKQQQNEIQCVVKEDSKQKQIEQSKVAEFIAESNLPALQKQSQTQHNQTDSPKIKNINQQNDLSNSSPGFSRIIDEKIQSLERNISCAIKNTMKNFSTEQTDKNNNEEIKIELSNEDGQCPPLEVSQIIEYHHHAQDDANNEHISRTPQASAKVESEHNSNYASQHSPLPATPSRSYNPVNRARFNRTIPQQSESQTQKQQLGQYREEQYPNGGKYCGFVYNDQRNGEGTFYYKDGGYYVGQWKNNAMNGFGRLYYDNGSLAYEGQWYKDEFHGRGRVFNDSSSELEEPFDYETFQNYECFWKIYDGDLAHDIKEGHGKLIFSNGQYFNGMFQNDVPHGEGYFHTRGQVIHGVWQEGRLTKSLQ